MHEVFLEVSVSCHWIPSMDKEVRTKTWAIFCDTDSGWEWDADTPVIPPAQLHRIY